MDYRIFTTENCSKCERLKQYFLENDIDFEEVDMASPESRSELAMNEVFTLSAPVLNIEDSYYTISDLFMDSKLNKELLSDLEEETDESG
ncbi:glutaredoxin domain-containing protein [Methanonatronarchaeum sp. AMET-Sl]|uniref:glutaredoxin domain-containing protein n=1 Tax=Methanonatronarchaeum sp. AMET-Sl TaxID=3037654 RepID=UPI00244DF9B1|nr:glutaredoxin domain-containing protein [Methanonatronarchaeum sp. AMET-Sl]WGI17597.1 glutaredoxin domain-containing protein [Methanonatronarchaeum sp. AMET-Sl]